jgi:hypothetical protein
MELGRGEGARTKEGALILLARKTGGKPEGNATISIPCRMHNRISRRKRRFEITVSTNTKKGFNAAKQEGEIAISGMQKPCVVAIVRSGVRGQGPPRFGAGVTTSTRNRESSFMRGIIYPVFNHAGKLAFGE